ncbi:MAG: hypothetical protein KDC65_17135, partial [Saprospiraceae bacterium]|nr:hypothetical protein [Saprospiraceae bacterium]
MVNCFHGYVVAVQSKRLDGFFIQRALFGTSLPDHFSHIQIVLSLPHRRHVMPGMEDGEDQHLAHREG